MKKWTIAVSAFLASISCARADTHWVQIEARDKYARSALADLGVSIESTRTDSVWGFASDAALRKVRAAGVPVLGVFEKTLGRGGHEFLGFPTEDSRYHDYAETLAALREIQAENPDLVALQVIGKSVEGRDLVAIHFNSSPADLASGKSDKPGALFMGNHHAREHLSLEIPLMWAQWLAAHRADPQVKALLDTRDIWIVPMVNPDGAEWDVSKRDYQFWRKNRRDNKDGNFGVDLNRNYGYQWGMGGSSRDTSDDTYMGPAPFSEPETQAMRDFVEAHLNAKILLSFHTYSELILYPWGHKYGDVEDSRDAQVFTTMAKTMARWNGYTPENSSALYIASGDTTDWAYGEHRIFAFTFELTPSANEGFGGMGFYPGARVIDRVFQDNLKPCLYLLDAADNPYKTVSTLPTGGLRHYVEPSVAEPSWLR
jgi:carboxypeptidase T